MDTQKYVIVDVHPDDAFYDWKDKFVGQVGTAKFMSPTHDLHGYLNGTFYFDESIKIAEDGEVSFFDNFYFYAIQLQTLEDNIKENSNVVHGMDDGYENSPA